MSSTSITLYNSQNGYRVYGGSVSGTSLILYNSKNGKRVSGGSVSSTSIILYNSKNGKRVSGGTVARTTDKYQDLREKIIASRPSLGSKEFVVYYEESGWKYFIGCDQDLQNVINKYGCSSIIVEKISSQSKPEDNGDVLFEAHLSLPKMAKEIRKFYLDPGKAQSVSLLRENLAKIFSSLQTIHSYTIHYKTELGMIPVNRDSELAVFMKQADQTRVIYILDEAKKLTFEVSVQLPQPELRVLYVNQEDFKSFSSLKKMLASMIPSLGKFKDFTIQWTDDAGRGILLTSDNELIYFLDRHSGTYKIAIVPVGKEIKNGPENLEIGNENVAPGEKLEEALEKLTSFGLHNEGDWLRTLLVVQNGDADKVLQTISAMGCAAFPTPGIDD